MIKRFLKIKSRFILGLFVILFHSGCSLIDRMPDEDISKLVFAVLVMGFILLLMIITAIFDD